MEIQDYALAIAGMEASQEFNAVFIGGKQTLDEEKSRREMETVACDLIHTHREVGAIVMECANMPPYAETVRRVTGVPVFDAVTLANHAYLSVGAHCR